MTVTAIERHVAAHAVGHPLRDLLLEELLADGEASPSMLARRLGEPLQNVSYHIRCLAAAGLIRKTRTRQRRGAIEHFYVAAYRVCVEVQER